MRLGVEDKLISATVSCYLKYAVLVSNQQVSSSSTQATHRRMYQIRILHDLRKQEAFLHIFK